MNILVLSPSLGAHGGIRVIVSYANYFASKGHHTVLQCLQHTEGGIGWARLHEKLNYIEQESIDVRGYDLIIATTPKIANSVAKSKTGGKKVYLLQMAEELFNPNDGKFTAEALQSYHSGMPIITQAHWLEYRLRTFGVTAPIHQVRNPIDRDYWGPAEDPTRDYVLVANWEAHNMAKDTEKLGQRVAKHLKQRYGVKIIGYGQVEPSSFDILDEYYWNPMTATLRQLYQNARFTLQASRYDVASLVGIESMACGTPVCRALTFGDEDLVHRYNCLRSSYNIEEFLYHAELMTESDELLWEFKPGVRDTASLLNQDRVMPHIEQVILNT